MWIFRMCVSEYVFVCIISFPGKKKKAQRRKAAGSKSVLKTVNKDVDFDALNLDEEMSRTPSHDGDPFSPFSEIPNIIRLAPPGSLPALQRIRSEWAPTQIGWHSNIHHHQLYKQAHPSLYKSNNGTELRLLPNTTYDKEERDSPSCLRLQPSPRAPSLEPGCLIPPHDEKTLWTNDLPWTNVVTENGIIDLK